VQQFIDRTSFIREFDLLRLHWRHQIMKNMMYFIDLLERGSSEEAIATLEQQLIAKTRLLPELVHGVMQRSAAENKPIEAFLHESPLRG
jgi:hypothetical protein